MIVFLTRYYWDGHVKADEMVGACGECGEEERCIHSFLVETWGIEATWKTWLYVGENCKIYLKEVGWEGVDLMDPAQDRVK